MNQSKENLSSISLHVPDNVLNEAKERAKVFDVNLSTVFWLAWELGKEKLYSRTPGHDSDGNEAPPKAAPPVTLPEGMSLPSLGSPPTLSPSEEKVSVFLDMPTRILNEIGDLATFADRSQSWLLQHAYMDARPALFGK